MNEFEKEYDPNYPDPVEHIYEFEAQKKQKPIRVDKYLANQILNATRNKVQNAIDEGKVSINGQVAKASRKIKPGDVIRCVIMKAPPIELVPENIPLEIIYEDDYLLVVNKPADMVCHPALGHRVGTLINALLYHFGVRNNISIEVDDEDDTDSENTDGSIFAQDEVRPGLVHRIDKDTTGLLVIAKDSWTHAKLAEQFANKTSERIYEAIAWGQFKEDEGFVEAPIARSETDRKNFCVPKRTEGKYAYTSYKVVNVYPFATHLQLKLKTGRTHQIRVHMSHINHPLMGDPWYGGDRVVTISSLPQQKALAEKCLGLAKRQMLHAKTLGFEHPHTKEFMRFNSDLPEDMQKIIELMSAKK
jgi:23S rRNA pseudouridine1911/1915/1917 synthase